MRGWFGPVGKCGCCGKEDPPPEPRPCECPGGGNSRKFAGTPTMIIEVDGLPSSLSWDSLFWVSSTIGGSGNDRWYWHTTQISGLDVFNGTHVHPMNKEPGGCIDFNATPTGSVFSSLVPTDIVIRDLGPSNNFRCSPPHSVTAGPESITASVSVVYLFDGSYRVSFAMAYRIPWGVGGHGVFAMLGRNLLRCIDNYDASLAPGSAQIGSIPGVTGALPHNSGEIRLVRYYNSWGNCYPLDPQQPHEIIGSFRAEIIDDVP